MSRDLVLITDRTDDASATFSPDRTYRYLLSRRLTTPRPPVEDVCVFVMLNPSTADAFQLDPTVRRCVGFARREGCDALYALNLFARRATRPVHLLDPGDPVGPDNDQALAWAMDDLNPTLVVAAWGTGGPAAKLTAARAAHVGRMLTIDGPIHCLGTTLSGAPRHPLYVKGDAKLEEWSP